MEAVRETLAQPGVRHRFLTAWIEQEGWAGGYKRANARLSQWLSGDGLYRFPLTAVLTLIRAAGHGEFLNVALALEAKCQREQRANAERYGPRRSVRPETRQRREIA
jgi:hypothetical protein